MAGLYQLAPLTESIYQQSWSQRLLLCRTHHFSSLAVAITITGTHYAYPQRDGQAEYYSRCLYTPCVGCGSTECFCCAASKPIIATRCMLNILSLITP